MLFAETAQKARFSVHRAHYTSRPPMTDDDARSLWQELDIYLRLTRVLADVTTPRIVYPNVNVDAAVDVFLERVKRSRGID